MKTNTIITIGRQYGSAGREIGSKVAEAFGIKLYDKEMLARAAKESGICEEIFETHDEKPTNSFLYSLVMDTYSMGYSGSTYTDMPINHKVFLAQFDAIKKIADEGPCILVGRCADYALAGKFPTLNIFIHSDMPYKVERSVAEHGLDRDKAAAILTRRDKARAHHYRFYTDKKWGDARNYDLCLDSGKLGVETCVSIIVDAYRLLQHKA